jgi:hypothetical protein
MSKYYKVYFTGYRVVPAEDVAEALMLAGRDWIEERIDVDADTVEELDEEDVEEALE